MHALHTLLTILCETDTYLGIGVQPRRRGAGEGAGKLAALSFTLNGCVQFCAQSALGFKQTHLAHSFVRNAYNFARSWVQICAQSRAHGVFV